HRPDIDHMLAVFAVAGKRGEQMFDRMGGGRGEVLPLVGALHTNIPSQDLTVVAIPARKIPAGHQPCVIDTKTCNAFHSGCLSRPWPVPRRARSPWKRSCRLSASGWHWWRRR